LSYKLQKIIDLLCNGGCYTLDEIQKQANLSGRQIEAAVAFLVTYGFAEMDKRIGLRFTRDAEKLFTKTF
jgi:predicted transcriptional regulator